MSARAFLPSSNQRSRAGLSKSALCAFTFLLVLPVSALWRLTERIDGGLLIALSLAVSLVTYFVYRSDKRRAEAGKWRIPESTLHLAELVGGWPGAFIAQRIYRHKTTKLSFQIVFWLIVLIHQFCALNTVWDSRLTNGIVRLIRP